MKEALPAWATGIAAGYDVGAQLATRDGRRAGNAVISAGPTTEGTFEVVTDVGTHLRLSAAEIEELFHPPRWTMAVETHPGVMRLRSMLPAEEFFSAPFKSARPVSVTVGLVGDGTDSQPVVELWQEYDCPACGIDFDIHEDRLLVAGESFDCSGCDGRHVAGVDGPTETYARRGAGSELVILPLPVDAAQRAAWLSGEFEG